MNYDLYLSFSGFKTYVICPRKYEFKYIKKTEGIVKDPTSSILGSTIGKIFELFYKKNLWERSDVEKACLDLIEYSIDDSFKNARLKKSDHFSFIQELNSKLLVLIPAGIKIIKENKFLSFNSDAEVDLTSVYRKPGQDLILKIGGVADFTHIFSKENIIILDGKASKYREQYVDDRQLLLYAFLFYLKYGVIPKKIGYIFWSFPENPVSWIDFDANSFRSLMNEFFEVGKKIHKLKIYNPTPSSNCKLCEFSHLCREGSDHLEIMGCGSKTKIDPSDSMFFLEQV